MFITDGQTERMMGGTQLVPTGHYARATLTFTTKSFPESFENSASLPLTAEIGLGRFMHSTHCRWIQSLSHGYATSTC